ncbi:MAG TPA: GNAT family N-acetyltransferase [Pyrinomonadaceae bacterium]|nr:GNAT family N-acetyltransferase [Pyrinomonadaceae bacterium]
MVKESGGRGGTGVNIRLAAESDAHALAGLRYEFRSSVGVVSERESEFLGRCRHWMRERLHEGGPWRCWVAERGGKPVGNLWAQLIEKIPNPAVEPECHAYVTNFYVREGERGRGTGSLLLAAALDWCRSSGVHAVILWPTERSRSLYLRHGFAVREDLLELIVGEK